MSKHGDYWFVPKLFGIGATPVTWQGWLVVCGFVALILAIVLLVPDDAIKLGLIVPVAVGFIVLTWVKTEGGWHWHWGNRDR